MKPIRGRCSMLHPPIGPHEVSGRRHSSCYVGGTKFHKFQMTLPTLGGQANETLNEMNDKSGRRRSESWSAS